MARRARRRIKRVRPLSPFEIGQREGAALGHSDGRWQGQCEAVMQATAVPVERRPYHILYVTSGKGLPYSPLDEGIQSALSGIVERLTIVGPRDNVVEVALADRPDLVLALDGTNFDAGMVQQLRMHGIRTAIWFTDDPYYTDITAVYAPNFDYVFTPERNCVPFYQQLGCTQVFNLPLGVHPESYRPRNARHDIRGDICFIGSAYWNRIEVINAIIPAVAHRKFHISGLWWDRMPQPAHFQGSFEPGKWMTPEETAAYYSSNRISINIHRSPTDETNESGIVIPAASPNPRAFEISACGTLQIVDAREDIGSYFIPNEEVVVYNSPEDLVAKLDYYLTHEEERQQIAWRALLRTMRDHTFAARVKQLMDAVQLT